MKKALIIGLNDYSNQPLQCCSNDAEEMSKLLRENGDGSPNFDIRCIKDECSSSDMYEAIEELFMGDAKIALLYFSGHGHDHNGGYICSTDPKGRNYGVSMEDILKCADKSKCENRIIILDCCFAAKLGEYQLLGESSYISNGLTILAASQNWQTADENFFLKHGVFTNLLLEGLAGGAADIAGNITPASLYSFVDQSLGAWQQRPVFKTNTSKFLPIRAVKAKVSKDILRRLSEYFENPKEEFKLNPSFEYTNTPKVKHEVKQPYANSDNVNIFKELQLLTSVGLIEPVGAEHMYFAAMESKACRLTKLGQHYWRLSHDKRL